MAGSRMRSAQNRRDSSRAPGCPRSRHNARLQNHRGGAARRSGCGSGARWRRRHRHSRPSLAKGIWRVGPTAHPRTRAHRKTAPHETELAIRPTPPCRGAIGMAGWRCPCTGPRGNRGQIIMRSLGRARARPFQNQPARAVVPRPRLMARIQVRHARNESSQQIFRTTPAS